MKQLTLVEEQRRYISLKIKIIDFGYSKLPERAHSNDAGADVYACFEGVIRLQPGDTEKIPLGIGLEVPDGYMACVFPRSGLSTKGIVCELPPIDSGYRGEIHAIVHNGSNINFTVKPGDRIGQLVVMPIVIADFVTEKGEERGENGFGSTGV